MKLHPSYIADLQTLTPLDNLWLKSSVPMFMDTACTLPVDNPCSLEVITLSDIRFKDNPTLTIIDSKGNELYVTQPILVEDSFASNAPAAVDTSTATGYFKRLRVNSTNEDGIDIRTGGSIAADQSIFANTFTTGGQNVTGTKISAWDAHIINTSNPHSTTFAQLGSKPTTLSGFGITDGVSSAIQYTNPTWLAGIDASTVKTGTIDPARLPVMPTQAPIVSTGDLTALTTTQQTQIVSGTIVTTTDGNRYVYNTGDKTLVSSYIQLADVTPDWSVIANRPTNVSYWNNDAGYALPNSIMDWTNQHTFNSQVTFSDYVFLKGHNIVTYLWSDNNFCDIRLSGQGFVRISDETMTDSVASYTDIYSAGYNGKYTWRVYADGVMGWYHGSGLTTTTITPSTTYGMVIGSALSVEGKITANGVNLSDAVVALTNNQANFQPKLPTGSTLDYIDGTGAIQAFPTKMTPYAHTHAWSDITSGKPTTLAGYGITDAASSSHTHTFASLTSKPTTLSGYGITDAASSTHTHTFASLTSKPTTLAGYGITDAATSTHNHDSTYFKLAAGSIHGVGTFTALYPTLAVGDGQYGMSALGGALNLYSVGGIKVFTRSGSADAVFAGNVWHSGNLGFGTSAGSMCQGNDSRLSDARTPNNNAAIVQGNINNSGAYGKRTTGLGDTALAVDGPLDSGFYDANGTGTPLGKWTHIINSAHNNNYSGAQYQFQFAASFDNSISTLVNSGSGNWGGEGYWVRTINTYGKGAWRKLWHDGNFDIGRVSSLETRATNLENASNTFLTISSASSTYLSKATASSTYLPLAGGTMANDAVVTFNRVTDGDSVKTTGTSWTGMQVKTTGTGVGAYTRYVTPSLSGSYWIVQNRDAADYGTTAGCFALEDSSAGNVSERFALWIEAGASGIAQFNRRVKFYAWTANYSSILLNAPTSCWGGIIMSGAGTDQTMMFAQVDSAGKFVRKTNINANSLVLDGAINTGNGSVFGGDITVNSCTYTKYLRVNKVWTDSLAARIGGDLALDGRLWAVDCSINGATVSSGTIGQWNNAWSRVASGRLCEDAYTGEDSLDWISRMNRGNHWGRINGVHSAPSYFNYMLIRETTGTKYSVIGCSADGNWYVGNEASNANLTSYQKIWTTGDFSSVAVNRINNSDSNYGFSRLYRSDDQSKYYLRHGWTSGQWYGNGWRMTCANDHADSQSGISTVAVNYADLSLKAHSLVDNGKYQSNLDTGFKDNSFGLWAGSIDAPTGTTPFGNSWTWLQEWGHSEGAWRAQLAIPYFSDSLAYRRKASGTWQPWRYCVTTDASGNLPSLKVPGGKTLTIDGSLLCNNTVSYTVAGSDLTGAGPYNIGDYSRNVVACPVATTIQLQTSTYSYFKIVHAIGGTVAVTAAGGATIKRGTGGYNTSYNIGAGGTAICGYTPGFGFWLGWLY